MKHQPQRRTWDRASSLQARFQTSSGQIQPTSHILPLLNATYVVLIIICAILNLCLIVANVFLSLTNQANLYKHFCVLWYRITYVFPASLTILSIKGLKTATAEWTSILHNVSLSSKDGFTFKATKMFHMPMSTFCFRTFISKDNLKKKKRFQTIACLEFSSYLLLEHKI